jgi:hypothetical protein
MPRPEWRDPAKEKYWRRLLAQWQLSGQTGRDFCAEHRLSESSFYAWKREIAQRDREKPAQTQATTRLSASQRSAPVALPAFLPVTMATPASSASALEVVLAHGRVLRVRSGFDADLLRQLLVVLEEPPC